MGIFIFVKTIMNGYKLWRLSTLEKEYLDYLGNLANDTENWEFYEKIPEIKEFLIKAGLQSSLVDVYENLGPAIHRYKLDLFENIAANNIEIASLMRGHLKQAIGVYKRRIREAYNPIYWIELLVYLPQNIVSYILGKDAIPNWLIRLMNAIWWICGFIGVIMKIPIILHTILQFLGYNTH